MKGTWREPPQGAGTSMLGETSPCSVDYMRPRSPEGDNFGEVLQLRCGYGPKAVPERKPVRRTADDGSGGDPQQILPHTVSVRVHCRLEMSKQRRRVLHLVDDGGID